MIELCLIGGPFDGAIGPYEWNHEHVIWFRRHDEPGSKPAKNGLIGSRVPRPGAVKYHFLASYEGSITFSYGDLRSPAREEREVVAA